MGKADIYKLYGIEYKAGKILSPFGWIPELIPVGTNTKIGNAGTWSIYHGNETKSRDEFGPKTQSIMDAANVDCVTGSCPCHCDGCYCDSGNYRYDSTKAANILKLLLAKLYPAWTAAAIKAQIAADGITQIRIHAAGDFFSRKYVNMWIDIITSTPRVTYWTYTKYDYAIEMFRGIPNVSIVPSITPSGINFGTCSELLEKYAALSAAGYRVHICACGTEYEKHCADCKTGCKAIEKTCDYVLFIKHSTPDYKAGKKDPAEYEAIKAIIRNQDN